MRNSPRTRTGTGFTLIEILVVIGLIAVLAAVVLVALNPGRQFAQARNTQRMSNVTTILNGIGSRVADNKGIFAGEFTAAGEAYTCPELIPGATYVIASAGAGTIDLACLTPTYIPASLPFDPSAEDAEWVSAMSYNTQYTVEVDAFGRYVVAAPGAELGEIVSATR